MNERLGFYARPKTELNSVSTGIGPTGTAPENTALPYLMSFARARP